VATTEHVARKERSRRRPPERFHVFVSYTTREDEVRIVKPVVDRFLNSVLRPVIECTVGEPPAFYDGYSLYNPSGARRSSLELKRALRFAIEESEVLMAFVSPEYSRSPWCTFECTTMASKELRPWFDLCRKPPVSELQDRRPPNRRPKSWECVRARLLMWLRRLRNERRKSGGAIVPVLWKGEVDALTEIPELERLEMFDWTSCVPALEAWERVHSHLFRHGSVSPSWVWEAEELDMRCQESMRATAVAIAEILRQRRSEYARLRSAARPAAEPER
jgi:hypothetical protein